MDYKAFGVNLPPVGSAAGASVPSPPPVQAHQDEEQDHWAIWICFDRSFLGASSYAPRVPLKAASSRLGGASPSLSMICPWHRAEPSSADRSFH